MEEVKKIILIVVIVIISAVVVGFIILSVIKIPHKFYSCEKLSVEGYCIEIELKTFVDQTGNDYSKFSFPGHLRQGDFLYIDEIKIIKRPLINSVNNDQINGTELTINLSPIN